LNKVKLAKLESNATVLVPVGARPNKKNESSLCICVCECLNPPNIQELQKPGSLSFKYNHIMISLLYGCG